MLLCIIREPAPCAGYETANGIGAGARVALNTLTVGQFTLWNVPAPGNRADMHASLLGTAFLKRIFPSSSAAVG